MTFDMCGSKGMRTGYRMTGLYACAGGEGREIQFGDAASGDCPAIRPEIGEAPFPANDIWGAW
jgi:hypothetical protein